MVTYYALLLAGSLIGLYDAPEVCKRAAQAEVLATAIAHDVPVSAVPVPICVLRETR